jgi:diaminohydroxyphosphoribosylaminopyrimidine deaminase/5-amino-6-(5-phosphoribosylamino)uracil reductase
MEKDKQFMLRAIEIAERGSFSTAPNPWVGCVIVRNGELIAEGYHLKKGGHHAEVNALKSLASEDLARGATAYVTLEPCCHHGATPPCVDSLIRVGVARVVVAIGSDPDQNVNGGGIGRLMSAGIEVVTGVCETEARHSLRAYLHQRRSGRPYVVAKVGASLNGLVAFEDGTSQWITSEASRSEAMRISEHSQAILVGVGTIIADNPRLTLRGSAHTDRGIVHFMRVVIDPNAKLALPENKHLNILSDGQGPTVVFTTCDPPANSGQVEWISCGTSISLVGILEELGRRGMIQVMVEGGSRTLRTFLDENLINEFTMFMSPSLIGSGGTPFYSGEEPRSVNAPQRRFKLLSVRAVENGNGDIRVDYSA